MPYASQMLSTARTVRSRLQEKLERAEKELANLRDRLKRRTLAAIRECREKQSRTGEEEPATQVAPRPVQEPPIEPERLIAYSFLFLMIFFLFAGADPITAFILPFILIALTGIGAYLFFDIKDKTIPAGDNWFWPIAGWLFGGILSYSMFYGMVEDFMAPGTAFLIFTLQLGVMLLVFHYRNMALGRPEKPRRRGRKKAIAHFIMALNSVESEVQNARSGRELLRSVERALQLLRSCGLQAPLLEELEGMYGKAKSMEESVRQLERRLELLGDVIRMLDSIVRLDYKDAPKRLREVEDICLRVKPRLELLNTPETRNLYNYLLPARNDLACHSLIQLAQEVARAKQVGLALGRRELEDRIQSILRNVPPDTFLHDIAEKILSWTVPPMGPVIETVPVDSPSTVEMDVEQLLVTPLKGLTSGPTCIGPPLQIDGNKLALYPENLAVPWTCCLIGCGGWGCVYKCDSRMGRMAFKVPNNARIAFETSQLWGEPPMLDRTARTHMRLRHPNILRLQGYGRRFPVLVYDYAERGNLSWQLSHGWKPSLRDTLLVGIQVGDALRYIHGKGLVHGDIKPGNILVSAKGYTVLGDLTQITVLLQASSSKILVFATPGWRAPEQVYENLKREAVRRGVENKADVYQLANLLLYLATGETVDGEYIYNEQKTKQKIALAPKPLQPILTATLRPEPWKRPSSEELVKHLQKTLASL